MKKVFLNDNSAGLSRAIFDGACARADENFAELTLRTRKFTIGAVGVVGCDHNFTTAANTTQQVIQLGGAAIIPARCRVRDVFWVTDTAFAGESITALTVEAGNSSSGAQFFADTDLIAANAVGQTAVGAGYTPTAISASASSVYVSAAPTGGNWAALLAGKASVYVTYEDVSEL